MSKEPVSIWLPYTTLKLAQGASKEFHETCKRVGVTPTSRQWRKWQRGTGSAYANRSPANVSDR